MELKQGDEKIDAYAIKVLRLSRFAPTLVTKERDMACQF